MLIDKKYSDFLLKIIKNDNLSEFEETLGSYKVDDTLDIRFTGKEFVFEKLTILNACIFLKASKIIYHIIGSQAHLTTTDKDNRNWLHFAACSGSLDSVRIFCDATKDNLKSYCTSDKYGFTPIHYAAMFGNFDLIKELEVKGIETFRIPDKNGRFPYHLACMYGHYNIVKYYIDTCMVFMDEISKEPTNIIKEEKYEEIQSLLKYSIKYGKYSILTHLLEDFRNVEIDKKIEGIPSLCYAAQYGYISIVRLIFDDLIKKGISKDEMLHLLNESDRSPLIDASLNGYVDIISFLIKQGSDPNKCDQRKISPLCAAAMSNNSLSAMKELIKNGAKIQPDKYEKLIIHIFTCKIDLYQCECQINNFTDDNFNIIKALCKNDNIETFNLIYDKDAIDNFIKNELELIMDKKKLIVQLFNILKKEGLRSTDTHYLGNLSFLKSSYSKQSKVKEEEQKEEEQNEEEQKEEEQKEEEQKEEEQNEEEQNEEEQNEEEQKEEEQKEDEQKEEEQNDEEDESDETLNEGEYDQSMLQFVVERASFSCKKYVDCEKLNPYYGRMSVLLNQAISNDSINIFKYLIENNFYPPDSTDIYIKSLQESKTEFCKIMLENNLYFYHKDKTLCDLVSQIQDETLSKQFLENGILKVEPQSSRFPFSSTQTEFELDNHRFFQPVPA